MKSNEMGAPSPRTAAAPRTVLITGGAGFIGSALVRQLLDHSPDRVINVDKLTYAGNLESLAGADRSSRYVFVQADICDGAALRRVLQAHRPDAVVHLAAESHVDRSIDGPAEFVRTNVVGTFELLDAARVYFADLSPADAQRFRFLHVSTDEVFGDLGRSGFFTETSAYAPSSPYSASKAGADHLARAWHRTYGLPVVVTSCSNNYGPFQFPEKLIPHTILNALAGRPLPVYGDGSQMRDWLHVDDHARALTTVLARAAPGSTYNIGGGKPISNLEVVHRICALLDELVPKKPTGVKHFRELVRFVTDRPGHDRRYAIDASRIERELGWQPAESFRTGLEKTVRWYLDNQVWWQRVLDGSYRLERVGSGLRSAM